MNTFTIHTKETASSPADATLSDLESALGFVPNVFAVIAESAPALQACVGLTNHLSRSSLTATEREIVQITTSVENNCGYCVAGHTAFAAMQGVPADVVDAARGGRAIADDRLEALRRLTRALVRQKGNVDQGALDGFFAAGYTREQVLEVILAICGKYFTNLTNAVAGIPLDEQFVDHAWQPESAHSVG